MPPEEDEALALDDELDPALDDQLDDELPAEAGEDDDEALAADPGEEPPARQPSRGARRIQTLVADRAKTQAELDSLKRELADVRAGAQRQNTAEQQRREDEALALMPYEERETYLRGKQEQRLQSLEQRQNVLYADLSDKQSFIALCAQDPRAAKYADRVEQTLAAERANNSNPKREVIFMYLYAADLLKRAPREATTQRRAGADRVSRETTRVPANRSGASGAGGARLSEREERRRRLLTGGPNGGPMVF